MKFEIGDHDVPSFLRLMKIAARMLNKQKYFYVKSGGSSTRDYVTTTTEMEINRVVAVLQAQAAIGGHDDN